MAKRPRGNHSPAFKAKVALAALKGARTLGGGSMSIPTGSRNGKLSYSKAPRAYPAAEVEKQLLPAWT
jgi:hypothetical protein